MARHTWHHAPNGLDDHRHLALTAAARGVLSDIREVLAKSEFRQAGNVSNWATWTGLDRKTIREGIEAIAKAGLLVIEKSDQGKAGVFYTISDPRKGQSIPRPTPNQPQGNHQASPNQPPSITQPDTNHGPYESANNAAFQQPSLIRTNSNNNSNREETEKETRLESADSTAGHAGAEAPADVDVFLTIRAKDGTSVHITASQVDEWQASLPAIAVEAELRKAAQWHEAAPTQQKKTVRGMAKFLYSWLMRTADKAANAPQRSPAPVAPPPGGSVIVGNGGRGVFELYQMRPPNTQEAG